MPRVPACGGRVGVNHSHDPADKAGKYSETEHNHEGNRDQPADQDLTNANFIYPRTRDS